jgi:uncharacterized protein involved in exopolysaccharide biosynthesis
VNNSTAILERERAELSLGEFISFVWRFRWLILSSTIVCTVLAAALAMIISRKYEGTVLLMPVSNQSSASGLGGLASVVSQIGGVASLGGLNLSGSANQKAEAIATLQSQVIVERYIQNHDLLPVLFSESWDQTTQKWISTNPKKIPTLWRGMIFFQKQVLNVTENSKTGLVVLTITWSDPKIAATWANDLVLATNDYLRDKAIRESERNIQYLNEQAAKTPSVEVRNAIYTVLETEIKKEMVARGGDEYALKVIDPAIPPEVASFPRPRMWTLAGFAFGLMLGTMIAAIRVLLLQSAKNPRAVVPEA